MSTELSIDARRVRLANYAKWGIGMAAAAVMAPVIFLAVKGIVGLIVAAVLGLASVNLAPVLAMKFASWKLKGLKHEARENPIETRQNIALQTRERLRQAAVELTGFTTEVKNFSDEVRALRDQQPEDAADFDEQLRKLQQLQKLKQDRLKAAHDAADKFEAATERAARKWKVAQSAIRMNKLAGQSQDDAMNKLLAAESLDSVQTAMNQAFAEMDTAFALQSLPAPVPVETIDINAVEIRERVRA